MYKDKLSVMLKIYFEIQFVKVVKIIFF